MTLFKEISNKNVNLLFDINNKAKSMVGLDLPIISVSHCMTKLIQGKPKKYIVLNARTHAG